MSNVHILDQLENVGKYMKIISNCFTKKELIKKLLT